MNKERLLSLERKKRNIPGIYNYCDRWCERCKFSSRCLSYALEKEEGDDNENRNMSNQKFWEKLSETFRMTRDLIRQAAAEQGIDLDKIDTSPGDELHQKSHEYAEKNPVAQAARRYSSMTSEWFNNASHLFAIDYNEKGNSIIIIPANSMNSFNQTNVENAVSVIRWYQFQISVKLMRALNGVIMEAEENLLWNDLQRDSDGSAKVSLIGIDQSIAAWGCMLENFPSKENSILDLLVFLERLRKDIEAEFPNARSFKRPGFDDETTLSV
jgi:hypothetical protein